MLKRLEKVITDDIGTRKRRPGRVRDPSLLNQLPITIYPSHSKT
jgi:hypothetical protein